MKRDRVWTILLALTLCLPVVAGAVPFTGLYVFGDSLSDTGNLFAITSAAHAQNPAVPVAPPSPPYFQGRLSNGPVAVEYLAANLGLSAAPAIAGGTNFAQAGATTGLGNTADGGTTSSVGVLGLQGVLSQVGAYLSKLNGQSADPSALYVVWGGPNDFFDGFGNPAFDPNAAIATAIANLLASVVSLENAGARHLLVPNLPDLGRVPRAIEAGAGVASGATALSLAFNNALAVQLANLQGAPRAEIVPFDILGTFSNVFANPAQFGFSNASDRCLTSGGVCADPGGNVFWDDIHPTTGAHRLIGEGFSAAVGFVAAVPEPNMLALFLIGMTGLFARRLRVADRR
jgi:phospholipase/lecithinase/hemolysin